VALRIVLAAACASGLLWLGAGAIAAKPATHTVIIEGLKFLPENLTVKRGDTVVWINKDPYPHTATAKGVFDSGGIGDGGSWGYTAREPGEHPYICTFHPNMKATLRVQ
jgi:plastocyanin